MFNTHTYEKPRTVVQGEGWPQLLIPPHAILAALRLQVPRAPAAICRQAHDKHSANNDPMLCIHDEHNVLSQGWRMLAASIVLGSLVRTTDLSKQRSLAAMSGAIIVIKGAEAAHSRCGCHQTCASCGEACPG